MKVKVSTDTGSELLPIGHDCLQSAVQFQLSVLRPRPGDVLVVKTVRPLDETARVVLDEVDKQKYKEVLRLLIIGLDSGEVEMWSMKRVQEYLVRKRQGGGAV